MSYIIIDAADGIYVNLSITRITDLAHINAYNEGHNKVFDKITHPGQHIL